MNIYTECPYCKDEIKLVRLEEKHVQRFGDVLIGESGLAICPCCGEHYDYKIRVLTTELSC